MFGDPIVAAAILDRRLHHSHVITIRGDSYRLREKRRSGLFKVPAVAETAAAAPVTRLAQVGPQGPPTRAAPSLVRALRDARGSLLWTTWTSHPVIEAGSTNLNRGSSSYCRKGSSSGRRLTSVLSRSPMTA